MPVTRGDIVDAVGATGTLQAVETVQVGTQVSGTVQELYADFNSIVKKGQVIARLDPSLLQTQIEQQEANVTRSEADLERLKVALADAKQKLDRAKAMFDKSLMPQTDLETAEVNVKSADAQIKSSEASLVQAKAQPEQPEGQPRSHGHHRADRRHRHLPQRRPGPDRRRQHEGADALIIAADLTKMQVNANIDEADVGRMRPGQDGDVPRRRLPDRHLQRRRSSRCACSRRWCRTS